MFLQHHLSGTISFAGQSNWGKELNGRISNARLAIDLLNKVWAGGT